MAMACIVSIATAANTDGMVPITEPITVTIHNNFPSSNLTVQCDPCVEDRNSDLHVVLPQRAYVLSLDPTVQYRWSCSVGTEKTKGALCSHAKSGRFVMWEERYPPMCNRTCPWFAGPDGLTLIEHPGATPVEVYNWPPQENVFRNC